MKLIILDRDGVINHDSAAFIKAPAEWQPIPGSLEAIARLTQAGYRVVVATNQSGIGRGLFDMATLNAINDKMHRVVAAGRAHRRVLLLPARRRLDCACRKTEAGMFREIGERLHAALEDVPCGGRRAARPAGGRGGRARSRSSCLPGRVRRRSKPAASPTARRSIRTSRPSPRRSLHSRDTHGMVAVRSALYLAILVVYTPFHWVLRSAAPLPRLVRWRVIAAWPQLATWLARHLLGIDYEVLGRDNIPREPCVILSKHQSAWETIAYTSIFPPHVYVIKRELLWIPFLAGGSR